MTSVGTSDSAPGDPEVLRAVGHGKKRRRLWKVLVVLLLLVGGVAAIAIWKLRGSASASTTYQTQRAEKGDLKMSVTATGTLKARSTVEVGAEITGRVLNVYVNFNDLVKEGQILAEIDTATYKARVEQASAQLAAASASLVNAKATATEAKQKLDRAKAMFDKELIALQDLEAADAAQKRASSSVVAASSQVTLAQASLTVSKTDLSKAVIRSPINGVVLDRAVEPGQTVTSGLQTPVLFVLAADLSELELRVQVDEADVAQVTEGKRATFAIDAYPQRVFESKVLAVKNMPTAGQSVVTYEAWLAVNNDERLLRPGMTAMATIIVDERKDVLLVPNAALRFRPPRRQQQQGFSINQILPTAGRGGFGQGRPQGQGQGQRQADGGTADGGKAGSRGPGVFVLNGAELKRISVEVGATDGVKTEVKSAELAEGAAVVVSALEVTGG